MHFDHIQSLELSFGLHRRRGIDKSLKYLVTMIKQRTRPVEFVSLYCGDLLTHGCADYLLEVNESPTVSTLVFEAGYTLGRALPWKEDEHREASHRLQALMRS